MYLDRIEITGFKSFADKTLIEFDKGVTAIVGPNGSGKSNLSEAIKWVLGEQSAKSLRGKKMDDIIFSGSQTRKPVNIAEVTLVLNNDDAFLPFEASEIHLTRRINRNGESDCFINKKPCRLKDIVNLLMDSGLGKDSFSIISQGKVETIFQNKPEERRAMFEEVAGVLKYKTRKTEASRKLDKTQEHLDRVDDILHEIHGQLDPLAKQKEKALIYQTKKETLSHIDIALMVAEIETLNEQWQVAKKELAFFEKQIEDKQIQEEEVTSKIKELKEALTTLEHVLLEQQNEYVECVKKVEKAVGEQNVLIQKLEFSKQNKEQQQDARFQKEHSIKTISEQMTKTKEEIEEKEQTVKQTQLMLDELRQEELFLTDTSQSHLENERQRYIDTLQEETRVKNELVHLEKELLVLTNQQKRFVEQESDLQKQQEIVKNTLLDKENELSSVQEQIDLLMSDYQEQMDSLDKERQHTQELTQTYEQMQQVKNRLEARKASLQDLNDDYAGFYQGVKEILKQRHQFDGVHGALAELIKVPKEYTVAIDIALGASMQHIVVSNEQSAMQTIQYLKQKRLGRATFLPLTVIKGRYCSQDILSQVEHMDGFIGVASDLVQTQVTYKTIVENFLGQTLVAKTLEQGTKIAKKIGYRVRVVSLDGEVIHSGGSMTGGATKQQTGSILSRNQQLEDVTKELHTLKDKLNETKTLYQTQKEKVLALEVSLQNVQQEGTKKRLEERDLQAVVFQLQEKVSQVEMQYDVLVKDKNRQQVVLNELKEQYDTIKVSEKEISQRVEKAKQHIDTLSVSQEERTKQLQALQPRIQNISAQCARETEQLTHLKYRLQELQKQLKTEQMSLQVLFTQQEEHLQSQEEIEGMIDNIKQELNTYQQEKIALEESIKQKQEEKKDVDTVLFVEETQEKDLQQDIQKLLRDKGAMDAKISRYDVTIDTHLSRLNEEYSLTFEAAKELGVLEITIQEASKQVSQLKREIEQLGPVNLTAIEEYDVVYERFTSMTEQQQDLIQAKDSLMATIQEMDKEMMQRFGETFYAIKHQFEKTFPKLFGGGRATLELTNPDDLLETGIDIVAQPPGKRLQNLSLLSGGERAFTAIALLFAILEVKPVPFCLLDEVEAALDEANVSRYGRYLKEFIDKTQFIVITHRKGTMEEADVLYGVTMQESGVSKLASVRFEDYEKIGETV
ncbi:chromosome segregation protein SMC [Carnobacteriaceae bacterium zg-ZUI78]|nr:chromosome segregation protein SMC [Carnobacteriaceae bacterium zg-ZUI78]